MIHLRQLSSKAKVTKPKSELITAKKFYFALHDLKFDLAQDLHILRCAIIQREQAKHVIGPILMRRSSEQNSHESYPHPVVPSQDTP